VGCTLQAVTPRPNDGPAVNEIRGRAALFPHLLNFEISARRRRRLPDDSGTSRGFDATVYERLACHFESAAHRCVLRP